MRNKDTLWPLYDWVAAKHLLTDFHAHSYYSPDGVHSIDRLCERAISLGFSAIAITEHMEWIPTWRGNFDIEAYFADLERAKQKYALRGLNVYSGVEVGNPHDYPQAYDDLLRQYPFDVVVASQHWLNDVNIHLESCFHGHDPEAIYRQYFREMERMILSCDFDVLGHFDRIFWPGTTLGVAPNLSELETEIRSMLAALIQRDRILELNARFLGDPINWNDIVASILCWYFDEGGRHVVVNSDAHNADQIGQHFELAYRMLENVRFGRSVVFTATALFERSFLSV